MKINIIILCVFTLFLTITCSPSPQKISHSLIDWDEAKLNTFNELERSILKIVCSAFYENYFYSPPPSYVDSISQKSLFTEKNFTTNSVAGTGLIISQRANKIVILTCYHILDFEDTVKTYYLNEKKQPTEFLQSLSIKYGQTNYITHKNGTISRGKVITQNEANDITLIEAEAVQNVLSEFSFQGHFCKEGKISLGEEIYLLGFPKGHFMITRGLASPSKYKNKFLVDVSFNRGFSGGIAITFDNKTGNYQYMGMANSTAYNSEFALSPSDAVQNMDIYKNIPYCDDIYIKELKMINYGITFVIKSDVIVNFFRKENEKLKRWGYDISNIIK